MPLSFTIVGAPQELPLSLAEAKLHLRVTTTDEDSLITDLISAATEWCEEEAEISLVTRVYRLHLDHFPCSRPGDPLRANAIVLPRPPLQSIDGVIYLDGDGLEQTLAGSDDYRMDNASVPGCIVPAPGKPWPATQPTVNAVSVTFTAGYGDAAAVPFRAKQAIKLLIGHWYEHREDVVTGTISTEVDTAARALLRQLWHGRVD